MPTRVFVDANVLFSRTQRDWLHHLRQSAQGHAFTLHTSEDVVAETLYRYRRRHPAVDGAVIAGLRHAVMAMMDDVVGRYPIDTALPLADVNDLHVHAAASAAGAQILLTDDTGWADLSHTTYDALPYDVVRPDSFFTQLDATNPDTASKALVAQMTFWQGRRAPERVDLVTSLRAAQCPMFAARVQRHLNAHSTTF